MRRRRKQSKLPKLERAQVDYMVKIRHKFNMNSRYNQTHSVKQMLRFGEILFDIGVVCHHHHPSVEQTFELGKNRVFLRTGTYKIIDDYARKMGYSISSEKIMMPCVALNYYERKMIPFFHLEEGISFINYKNKEVKNGKNRNIKRNK